MTPEAASSLYALGLIALILWTVAMIVIMPKTARRFKEGSLCALVVTVLCLILFTYGRHSSSQIFAVIPGLAFGATVAALRPDRLRLGVGLILLVPALFLAYATMSQAGFAGPSFPDSILAQRRNQELDWLRHTWFPEVIRETELDLTALPAGWLSEPPYDSLPLETKHVGIQHELIPLWHTWLTGQRLYRRHSLAIWVAGGTVDQAAAGLELRRRHAEIE